MLDNVNRLGKRVSTYFRFYYLDLKTGNAVSSERKFPPLFFLSPRLRRRSSENKYSIYDYFATDEHANLSIQDSIELIELLERMDTKLSGHVLDISGGNGVVLQELKKRFPIQEVYLTEVNNRAIQYGNLLGIPSIKFDFELDDAGDLAERFADVLDSSPVKFDFILLRACIMFCNDLGEFLEKLSKIMTPNGKIVIQHSVEFTMGMALRTQLDDSSYKILRTYDTISEAASVAGLKIISHEYEIDSSMYVYENDRSFARRILQIYYEQKMINSLSQHRLFNWAARDRRRSHYLISK